MVCGACAGAPSVTLHWLLGDTGGKEDEEDESERELLSPADIERLRQDVADNLAASDGDAQRGMGRALLRRSTHVHARLTVAAPTGLRLWSHLCHITAEGSSRLCETLRLVLAPTLATRLQGDYKTGKRINMRKVRFCTQTHSGTRCTGRE